MRVVCTSLHEFAPVQRMGHGLHANVVWIASAHVCGQRSHMSVAHTHYTRISFTGAWRASVLGCLPYSYEHVAHGEEWNIYSLPCYHGKHVWDFRRTALLWTLPLWLHQILARTKTEVAVERGSHQSTFVDPLTATVYILNFYYNHICLSTKFNENVALSGVGVHTIIRVIF